MTNCAHCGKLVDPHLDNCPYCGGFLRAKQPDAAQQQREQSQTCPACGALVQPGDIICVACGTNLLTGQKVTEERKPVKTRRSFQMNWTVVGFVLAGIIVLAIAVAAVALLTRDPLAQAQRLAEEGNTGRAITILEDVVEGNPDNIRAQEELGKLYWKTDRYLEAAAALEHAATLEPTRRDAALLAVVSLASAPGSRDYDREESLLQQIVQNYPDDATAWYLLALVRGAKNDIDGEIDALQKVITLNPASSESLKSLGLAMAQQGRNEEARRNLRAVLTTDPTQADALATLGIVDLRARNEEAAEENLQDALQAGTSIPTQANMQLGLLLVQQGRHEDAIPHFDAVLSANRSDVDARYFRAVCQRERGLLDEALRDFEDIARGNGKYAGLAALEAARVYLAEEELELAQSALDRAEQNGVAGAPYLTIKGRVLAMEGEDVAAQDLFKRAITTNPNYAPAYLENGLVYVRRGLFKEGINSLKKYLELADPTIPGTSVNEIQTLVDQLETSLGQRT